MKVLVVLLFVTAAIAAPQGAEIDNDAEVVPPQNVPGSEGGEGFVFVLPGYNPFTNFFRNIFSRRPSVTEDGIDAVDIPASGVGFSSDPDRRGGSGTFFSFIDSILRNVPSFSDNSTITFQNSTTEVVNYGGVPMLVNRTVVERTSDDGAVYRSVHQVIGPLPNSTSTSIPATENETEIEPSSILNHHLQKRWIASWFTNALRKRNTAPRTSHNHLPGSEHLGKEEKEERAPDSTYNLEDDIAVNYLGVRPPHNPDAEVFDPDLMREDERTFRERRRNSVESQPPRSHPMMSQPLRSQPMMSQPLRSQPMMSQPLRSEPVMSQPLRSQPMMSQPLRSQPLRSQPMMSQPLRSEPMMSQPPRSRSVRL